MVHQDGRDYTRDELGHLFHPLITTMWTWTRAIRTPVAGRAGSVSSRCWPSCWLWDSPAGSSTSWHQVLPRTASKATWMRTTRALMTRTAPTLILDPRTPGSPGSRLPLAPVGSTEKNSNLFVVVLLTSLSSFGILLLFELVDMAIFPQEKFVASFGDQSCIVMMVMTHLTSWNQSIINHYQHFNESEKEKHLEGQARPQVDPGRRLPRSHLQRSL